MFHLMVKYSGWSQPRDVLPEDRLFEYTDPAFIAACRSEHTLNVDRLRSWPALFMTEIDGTGEQHARVGRISSARIAAGEVRIEHSTDATIAPIANTALEKLGDQLEIDPWEFRRTHWAIKDADLFEVLCRNETSLRGLNVEFGYSADKPPASGHIFIAEQLAKLNDKLQSGDYDGAITNARSLVEAVLREIENQLGECSQPDDGDLLKRYKRVQRQLNLEPGRADLKGPLQQVLSGLAGVVSGIAGVSNKMGDRHARTYEPAERHAMLAANAAKTLADFLVRTETAQRE